MPLYLGPYDVVVIDGREYRRGDNVAVSQSRLDQLRSIERYRFDGDDPVHAAPIMSNTPDEPHVPNEFGVPQDPKPTTNAAKATAAAAVPDPSATPSA